MTSSLDEEIESIRRRRAEVSAKEAASRSFKSLATKERDAAALMAWNSLQTLAAEYAGQLKKAGTQTTPILRAHVNAQFTHEGEHGWVVDQSPYERGLVLREDGTLFKFFSLQDWSGFVARSPAVSDLDKGGVPHNIHQVRSSKSLNVDAYFAYANGQIHWVQHRSFCKPARDVLTAGVARLLA